MGKAVTELNKNRKIIFDEYEENTDSEIKIENNILDSQISKIESIETIERISMKIHQEIMDYVKNNAVHLCEFLQIQHIEQYITNL
tara:strand:+ start:3148 stop:3405 length:258 start_codon:yes stop_codon:yes gene_type:complete